MELFAEGKLDLVGLAEASIVIRAAHILGERFHICGFLAVEGGLAQTVLFLGFGNTKELDMQLGSSLLEVSAELVGVFDID